MNFFKKKTLEEAKEGGKSSGLSKTLGAFDLIRRVENRFPQG